MLQRLRPHLLQTSVLKSVNSAESKACTSASVRHAPSSHFSFTNGWWLGTSSTITAQRQQILFCKVADCEPGCTYTSAAHSNCINSCASFQPRKRMRSSLASSDFNLSLNIILQNASNQVLNIFHAWQFLKCIQRLCQLLLFIKFARLKKNKRIRLDSVFFSGIGAIFLIHCIVKYFTTQGKIFHFIVGDSHKNRQ
jgi:hypothetical protein